jgi:hypothetical protein
MAALLASFPAASGRAAPPAVPPAPVFGEPVTVDAQRLAGEPDITLAAGAGAAFAVIAGVAAASASRRRRTRR